MYLDRTHRNTCKIHAGYIEIHQDTYPIGNYPPKNDRKPHVTRTLTRGLERRGDEALRDDCLGSLESLSEYPTTDVR